MSDEFEFKDEEESVDENYETIPDYGSENWENYVMKQFLPEELYEGNYPTLNGMRRVCLKVLGNIVSSKPVQVISNLPNSSYCVYELVLENGLCFGAAADGHQENINGPYVIYPTAIAESRAEARTYRKALLISTASAEEIKGNEKTFNSVLTTVSDYNEKDPISQQQKTIIESKCKQLGIDLAKFLESEEITFEKAQKSDGVKLSKKLSEFQQKGIPQEIKSEKK